MTVIQSVLHLHVWTDPTHAKSTVATESAPAKSAADPALAEPLHSTIGAAPTKTS
jgi:hypothetical protein